MNEDITWYIYQRSNINLLPTELGQVTAPENSTQHKVLDKFEQETHPAFFRKSNCFAYPGLLY